MKKSGNSKIIIASITGGVIVAVFLILGTFWIGQSASKDTSYAVRNVSLLYLDELAARREQVVSSTLQTYMGELNVALGLMESTDLDSTEHLQEYQARMKRLYDLEKFAFVDTDGVIYTSRGTRSDIDAYDFDYTNLTSAEVSVKNMDSDDKKVVIAEPVDNLSFEGHTLVVCFMEIDMDTMLSSMSFEIGGNNSTYCNLYNRKGASLTNVVLGGLAAESSLFEALEQSDFEEGYSVESLEEDFSSGKEGVASFSYDGTSETFYYMPVSGTDWMLTYLIRESVIENQITSISEGIITRSLVLSVITAALLIAIFIFLIVQMRKASAATLKMEITETENRVKQQELEEQLALQEELLDQEQKRVEQDKMITALSSDYKSVYYVDLDKDEAICYRKDDNTDDVFGGGRHFEFHKTFEYYGYHHVDEEYRNQFLKFIDTDNIRKNLEHEEVISILYLSEHDGRKTYEALKMAGVRHSKDRDDHMVHAVGIGFTDMDSEMKESMAKSNALSDALKAAEEASKAKTIFLSNMSHEIRTPMNAIIGLDKLALNDPNLSDVTRDYLEKMGSSADHLLSLINDVLDMSRIESGRMVLHKDRFDFYEMIDQVKTMFAAQCQDKGLEFTCDVSENIERFFTGDDMKLRQVLINILGNAVKFTPKGGSVGFEAEKTAEYDGKSTLQFIISDTGIGMSEEYVPKIFDTFSQENDSSANKYGSSGLGMAISKNIVELMNGHIEVKSKKDEGTVFTVTVTLADADEDADGTDATLDKTSSERKGEEGAGKSDEAPHNLSGLRILVAEDMDINAQIMISVLEMRNIHADHASDGEIALEMFESKPEGYYAAILMDMRMPHMDGLKATQRIRAMDRADAATIPIIALTANAFDEDVQKSMQAGLNAHLSKPVEPDILFRTLEELVED